MKSIFPLPLAILALLLATAGNSFGWPAVLFNPTNGAIVIPTNLNVTANGSATNLTGNALAQATNIASTVVNSNLPGSSTWSLINSNLVLNSTNFTITPSTNIVITGAGAAQVNGTYLGFYPGITNMANSAVATLASGLFVVAGPGINVSGYPLEIDDAGYGTNYYYSTNGIIWYATSSAYNPPPSGAINYSGFATNFTVLPVSIPGLHSYTIWNFGAKGGTNDDTAAFIAAAQSGQIVNLDPGTNYTISRLTLPSGANIDGHGAKVIFSAGLTGYAITCTNNGNHTIFKNVILDGGLPANWSFVGSNVVSAYTNVWRSGFLLGAEMPFSDFSGCVAQNLQDRGFTFIGNLGQFPQPTSSSTVLNGIQAYSDWVGAEFVNSAEYVVANSWQIKYCGHALHIFSGNDQLTGVNFTRNGIAVYITGASYTDPNGVTNDNYSVANAAHGVLSGCLNHNGYAAWLSEFNQGFAFNNVTIQGANTLNNIVMMTNVTGVTILGGQPGTSQIIVNGSDSNSGDNYYNWQGLSNYPSVFTYGTGKLHVISGAVSELNSVLFSNGIVTATSFVGSGAQLTGFGSAAYTASSAYDAAGTALNATNNASITRLGSNLVNNITVTGPGSVTLTTNGTTGRIGAAVTVNGQTNTALTRLSQNDAGGLTNLPAAQLAGTLPQGTLPAGVVTNNASGVTLNGTLSGNGGGINLSNLTSSLTLTTNQSVQITNAIGQVLVAGWIGGVPSFGVVGTNNTTSMQIGIASGGTTGGTIAAGRVITINLNAPFLTFTAGTGASSTNAVIQWGNISSSAASGMFVDFGVHPIYNQSGTAGGMDFFINRTNVTIGSGSQYQIRVGVTTNNIYSDKFFTDINGNVTATGQYNGSAGGLTNIPAGGIVGGITTNLQFTDGNALNPSTNTLYFTNGILMRVTQP